MDLFDYPKSAVFGRVLPKNKIYDHGSPRTSLKELFVRQVGQIVWQYKLAPETINVQQTRSVPEIQVFSITLKTGELKQDVLSCIDQAVMFPIVFELRFNGQVKVTAAYKRPNEADSSKWVLSDYFETPWLPENTPRKPLPIVLNLEDLYTRLLLPLMPHPARPGESLREQVERMSLIKARQKELDKQTASLTREKQFNRKIEINRTLRDLMQELETLTTPLPLNGHLTAQK